MYYFDWKEDWDSRYCLEDDPILLQKFSFVQFVGLDGFDTSSCKWLNDAATQVGQPAFTRKAEDEVRIEKRKSLFPLPKNTRSSALEDLQVLSKSIVRDVAASLSRKVEENKHTFSSRLPRIMESDNQIETKPSRKGRRKRPCRGKLVYEEEPQIFPQQDIMDRLIEIEDFGSKRKNYLLNVDRKTGKLPSIGLPYLRSNDTVSHEHKYGKFPYRPGTRAGRSGRGVISGGKNTGLPWRRKQGTDREVPPNLFGYRGEPEELAPTLVRKCGGGGYASSVDINERKESERMLLNAVSKANSFPRLKGKQSCVSVHSSRSWK